MTFPCCETMKSQYEHTCGQHGEDCPDRVITIGPNSRRLYLTSPNADYSFQFCPWCATELPEKLKAGKLK